MSRRSRAKPPSPFRRFNSSPEVIRLVVMMYVRFPLSLRNVEDLLFERGIDICHETVRMWWNRFGPMFAGDIRRQRVSRMRGFRQWRWHLDEMYVKLNGEMVYLWRAVDHEGEVLESYITKTRDKDAALDVLPKAPPLISRVRGYLSCYPFLDHLAGRYPVPAGQGGPCAADRFTSDIGGLLPIALCGRTSL